MHGLGLDYSLSSQQKKEAAKLSKAKPIIYMGTPRSDWDEIEMLSSMEKMRFQMYRLMIKFSENEKQEIKNTDASMEQTQFILPQLNLKRKDKTPQPRTVSMLSSKFHTVKNSMDTASRVSSGDMN